ncbi:hypothetical protein [Enterobacter sp. 22466]|uniref:hypothetical protein n=1 Tax=Enterobacter sp. 22466 TaxID=3453924 RepID=UPI003F83EE9E
MAKRKKIYSSPFEAEWAVLNHKAFLPHQRVTTEGKAMDKEQLAETVKALRRRQLCVRESISILRRQWQADQKTLEELMPEAVAAGLTVQLEIDEP